MSNKKQFNQEFLIHLAAKRVNPIPTSGDNGVASLLALCDDEEDVALLIELLERFRVVKDEDVVQHLDNFLNHVQDTWGHSISEVIFLSAAADSQPDSSQALLQSMKYSLGRAGKTPAAMLNQLSEKNLRKVLIRLGEQSVSRIIIVDEFAGTGKTILSRVNSVSKMIENIEGQSQFRWRGRISVSLVAGMQVALKRFAAAGIPHFCSYPLEKGLTGFEPKATLRKRCQQMLKLESRLLRSHAGQMLPRFGYGASQSLFSRLGQNVPNNVFPIFWWKHLATTEVRQTLLELLPNVVFRENVSGDDFGMSCRGFGG